MINTNLLMVDFKYIVFLNNSSQSTLIQNKTFHRSEAIGKWINRQIDKQTLDKQTIRLTNNQTEIQRENLQ